MHFLNHKFNYKFNYKNSKTGGEKSLKGHFYVNIFQKTQKSLN